MKKNLGVVQAVYPMPVLIVAAYDENKCHERRVGNDLQQRPYRVVH